MKQRTNQQPNPKPHHKTRMSSIKIHNTTIIIPDKQSPCDLWKRYFLELKQHFGTAHAKSLWLLTWASNGAASCTTSAGFNQWLAKYDIDVSTMATKTIADLGAVKDQLFGLSKGITKVLTIGIPVVLIAVLIGIVLAIYNSAKNASLSDVAALTPQGRAVTALNHITRS